MSDESSRRTFAIPVEIGPDGITFPTDIPEELKAVMAEAVLTNRANMLQKEIDKWITPQIAHEILSVYGDERATPPSVSTGALISLIRTCNISDEEMLRELNDVEEFHGYVLAVCVFAEENDIQKDGLAILRAIADLLNDDDLAEIEQLEADKA